MTKIYRDAHVFRFSSEAESDGRRVGSPEPAHPAFNRPAGRRGNMSNRIVCRFSCDAVTKPVHRGQIIGIPALFRGIRKRALSESVVAPLDHPTLRRVDSVRVGGTVAEVTRILHFYGISARRRVPIDFLHGRNNGRLHQEAKRRCETRCS